jgi:hypothetical protein
MKNGLLATTITLGSFLFVFSYRVIKEWRKNEGI